MVGLKGIQAPSVVFRGMMSSVTGAGEAFRTKSAEQCRQCVAQLFP